MKVLILGCGGFIGSHLINEMLKDDKFSITGIDVTDYKIKEHLYYPKFKFIKSDVYKYEHLRAAIRDHDLVIFLASICNPALYIKDPIGTINSNFTQPVRIVDLCTKYRTWLITFSTCEVYGRTISSYIGDDYSNPDFYIQDEETTPYLLGPLQNQRWSYSNAKQLLDRYIYANGDHWCLPYTIIRPYNFFGSRMDYIPEHDGFGVPRVLACFMKALLDREPIKLVDGGEQYRTITYIDDAIEAIMTIINNPDKSQGNIFNIANPENETTIRGLAEVTRSVYADISGDENYKTHPIESVDSGKFYGRGYEDCDRRVPNIDRIKALGWEPKTNLENTMRKTLEFFYEFYKD